MRKSVFFIPYMSICLLPLLLLLIKCISDTAVNPDIANGLFQYKREGLLLLKTFIYAISVAAADVFVGILAAIFVCRTGYTGFNRYKWLIFMLLPVPVCVHSMAWLKAIGTINRLSFITIPGRGMAISWFIQSMSLLPVAVAIIAGGVLYINRDQINAARILRSDTRLAACLLPNYLKPQIFAAAAIVFLITVNDYAVPSIFSESVYSLELFVEYSSSLSMSRTLLKSFPLLVIELFILVSILNILVKVFLSGKKGEMLDTKLNFSKAANAILYSGTALMAVQFLIPGAFIVLDKSMWQNLGSTLKSTFPDIWTSFMTGIISVLIGYPVIFLTSYWLHNIRNKKFALFLVLLPAVIPSSLIGAALINMYNTAFSYNLYNSVFMPVLAILIRFMPYGVIIVSSELERVDKQLLFAAMILEKSRIRTVLKILYPIASTSLLTAVTLVFLLGIGELGATLMVIPPGISTITVRLYNYLHYGASESVSGISLIITAITISAVFAVKFIIGVKGTK